MTPDEIKAAIDAAIATVKIQNDAHVEANAKAYEALLERVKNLDKAAAEKIATVEKRLSVLEKAKTPAISTKEIAVIRENAESAVELAKFAQDEVRELSIRILGPGAVPSTGE